MSLEKLKQAKRIQKKIREQQEKLHFFEMGKISCISVRKFENHNCTFEEEDYAENIPRSILKKVMVDYLKKDIENLNNKLNNLFK
jgi:hypothetical protein